MQQTSPVDTDLPLSIGPGLQQLCDQLEVALGDELEAVILYGGLAKQDEYHPRTSDVNVMVILKTVTVELLDKATSPVQKAMRDLRLTPMVLSEDDLRRSTDVFPAKFLDMQRHHRVLWGKDVLTDLTISEDHLRLRCEQEMKNLLLRLRNVYLQRGRKAKLIQNTLTSVISSFLNSLSTLLILKTGKSPNLKAEIVAAAVQELELSEKPLQEILALKRGEYKPNAAELKQLYDGFMDTVQKSADIVDKL